MKKRASFLAVSFLFSIFAITLIAGGKAKAAVNYTVTFINADGTEYIITSSTNSAPQIVPAGQAVNQPLTPSIPTGKVSFRGWSEYDPASHSQEFYTRDKFWSFAADPNPDPVNTNVILYAVFSDKYLISFKNDENLVVQTREVAPNNTFAGPDQSALALVNPPQPNQRLMYWYDETDPLKRQVVFGSRIAESDMMLVPFWSDAQLVLFDSQGGTTIDPQLPVYGTTATAPTNPTRAGYTFSYWSATKPTTSNLTPAEYSFSTPVTQDITLYAVWTPQYVSYTIAIWIEKPDVAPNGATNPVIETENYAYQMSISSTAINANYPAGSYVSFDGDNSMITSIDNQLSQEIRNYTSYYCTDPDSQPLAGDGSSVVNVYFTRDVYTITFNMNGGTLTNTSTGQSYTGTQYWIQAKVGENISDRFPIDPSGKFTLSGPSANPYFISFTPPTGVSDYNWMSSRPIYSLEMIQNNTKSYTVTATWSNNSRQVAFHEMKEALPGQSGNIISFNGKNYIEDTLISSTYYHSYSGHYGKPIAGFSIGTNDFKQLLSPGSGNDANNWTDVSSNLVTDYYRFYTRNRYSFTFDLNYQNSENTVVTDIMYEQSLSTVSGITSYKATVPTREGYTFGGWYKDASCTTGGEFDFTIDMPNSPLIAYAKWVPAAVTVKFYTSIAVDTASKAASYIQNKDLTTNIGGTVSAHSTPIYTANQSVNGKGVFLGWVWLINNQYPVDFVFNGTTIDKDLDVYATWRTTGFTITYEEGSIPGETIAGSVPIDSNTYALDQYARVKSGATLVPPSGWVFYGWNSVLQSEGVESYPFNLHKMTGDTILRAVYLKADGAMKIIYHPTIDDYIEKDEVPPVTRYEQYYPTNADINLYGSVFTSNTKQLVGWASSEALAKAAGAADLVQSANPPAGYYPLNGDYHTQSTAGAEVHLYGVWQPYKYRVRFAAELGGSITGQADWPNIPGGTLWSQALTVPTPVPDDGWKFVGWTPAFPATVIESAVYTAHFEPIVPILYTVEYYYQNTDGTYPASANPSRTAYGADGKPIYVVDADKEPDKSKDTTSYNYAYTGDSFSLNVLRDDALNSDGSTILKVYFKLQFTIVYDPGLYGTWNKVTQTYANVDYGKNNLPAFSANGGNPNVNANHLPGYIFTGWSPMLSQDVTQSMVYVAQWEFYKISKYTVEYYDEDDNLLERLVLEGTTGQLSEADILAFEGLMFDPNNPKNILSGIVTEDDKLVLIVYYKKPPQPVIAPGPSDEPPEDGIKKTKGQGTGDEAHLTLWLVLMLSSFGVILFCFSSRRKIFVKKPID
jgi:uncharacterized repeat protein (TIGR02543 family)